MNALWCGADLVRLAVSLLIHDSSAGVVQQVIVIL